MIMSIVNAIDSLKSNVDFSNAFNQYFEIDESERFVKFWGTESQRVELVQQELDKLNIEVRAYGSDRNERLAMARAGYPVIKSLVD